MRYFLILALAFTALTAKAEEQEETSACETGAMQSPISIAKATKAELPEIEADYKDVELTVERKPNFLALYYPEGSVLKLGDKSYQLQRIVFHTPAEHVLNGRRYDLEVQLEHKAEDGKRLNLSVMMKRGFSNGGLEPLLHNIPRANTAEEPVIVEGKFFTPQILLPANLDYYTYEGSDTLAPCKENVEWVVLKSYVELGGEQLTVLKKILGENARSAQAIGGRAIRQK